MAEFERDLYTSSFEGGKAAAPPGENVTLEEPFTNGLFVKISHVDGRLRSEKFLFMLLLLLLFFCSNSAVSFSLNRPKKSYSLRLASLNLLLRSGESLWSQLELVSRDYETSSERRRLLSERMLRLFVPCMDLTRRCLCVCSRKLTSFCGVKLICRSASATSLI